MRRSSMSSLSFSYIFSSIVFLLINFNVYYLCFPWSFDQTDNTYAYQNAKEDCYTCNNQNEDEHADSFNWWIAIIIWFISFLDRSIFILNDVFRGFTFARVSLGWIRFVWISWGFVISSSRLAICILGRTLSISVCKRWIPCCICSWNWDEENTILFRCVEMVSLSCSDVSIVGLDCFTQRRPLTYV